MRYLHFQCGEFLKDQDILPDLERINERDELKILENRDQMQFSIN